MNMYGVKIDCKNVDCEHVCYEHVDSDHVCCEHVDCEHVCCAISYSDYHLLCVN